MNDIPLASDREPEEDRVEELAFLLPEPDPAFRRDVLRRIDRQVLAGGIVELAWEGTRAVVIALLSALISAFRPNRLTQPDKEY